MPTMTRREEYANNLKVISEITGERYYRRLTFKEADEWYLIYENEMDRGYPSGVAAQRAWDCIFAVKQSKPITWRTI